MCESKVELSVIVPVYNAEKYIERCLQSILNQTYSVGEVICVNDGSTDSSLEILKDFQERDGRIKIVHKKNGGLVSAKKTGLLNANGKYVAFVDADDWIERDMYKELMNLLLKSDADIVTSGCMRDYGNYCVTEPENIAPGIYDGEKLAKDLLGNMISTDHFFESNISMHHWNKIYRYDLFFKWQLSIDDSVNAGDDAGCVYPCLLNASRVAVIGKNYYHYCLRDDSTMSNKDTKEQHHMLFDRLRQECVLHTERVPNIMEQMNFLEDYVLLLQRPECMMIYKDEILFPFGRIAKNEKVLIYGAGRFGKRLKDFLEQMGCFQVVGCVDKKNSKGMSLDKICEIDYDIILIGVLIYKLTCQIKQELLEQGVEENKILMVDGAALKSDFENHERNDLIDLWERT